MTYVSRSIYLSIIFLVTANIIPLFGVIFLDWSIFQILFIYWLETAIIGFFNIFKIIKVEGFLNISSITSFLIHYGIFMLGHLAFIVAFFTSEIFPNPTLPSITILSVESILIPFVILCISHGLSFFFNFIQKEEYKKVTVEGQKQAPYSRVVIMHATVIFGGWLIGIFGNPLFGLVVLVVLKIIIDIVKHIKEHNKFLQKNSASI